MFPDEGSRFISQKLKSRGYSAYIVGGAVRDHVMEKMISDYDMATDALPEEVMNIFERTIPTGLKHGTVTVLYGTSPYEVTTMRQDGNYLDLRHPENVTYVREIEKDLQRRDFTINAMAYDIENERIIDPFDGQGDIIRKLIRTAGNPDLRFSEDALRIIRGIRFASVLGFKVEDKTLRSMKKLSGNLKSISQERIYTELSKILLSEVPSVGMNLLLETGCLDIILPELIPMDGFLQHSPYHDKDVWGHTMEVLDNTPADILLRLSALFHDSGKPSTFTMDEKGIGHFYGHELVSEKTAEKCLLRLRADKETIRNVKLIISKHMVPLEIRKPSKIKNLLKTFGADDIHYFFDFKKADNSGYTKEPDFNEKLETLKSKMESILINKEPLTVKDLAVTGSDLMEEGFSEGPEIGKVLEMLLKETLGNPELNTKEKLISLAGSFRKQNNRLKKEKVIIRKK